MKVVGAGLSKTGTMTLSHALRLLGYGTIHNDMLRLNDVIDGTVPRPDFRRYEDIDAVVDLPSAWYYRELLDAYPEAKCILTVREEDSWWRSISAHTREIFPLSSRDQDPLRWDIRCLVYGSADPREFTYRKVYQEHNARVQELVPESRLLVMDIIGGDGWEPLCRFLDAPVPTDPFPHGNSRKNLTQAAKILRSSGAA
ncbi:MAG: sulfotransferase [Kiloniellaceae bacterium]